MEMFIMMSLYVMGMAPFFWTFCDRCLIYGHRPSEITFSAIPPIAVHLLSLTLESGAKSNHRAITNCLSTSEAVSALCWFNQPKPISPMTNNLTLGATRLWRKLNWAVISLIWRAISFYNSPGNHGIGSFLCKLLIASYTGLVWAKQGWMVHSVNGETLYCPLSIGTIWEQH